MKFYIKNVSPNQWKITSRELKDGFCIMVTQSQPACPHDLTKGNDGKNNQIVNVVTSYKTPSCLPFSFFSSPTYKKYLEYTYVTPTKDTSQLCEEIIEDEYKKYSGDPLTEQIEIIYLPSDRHKKISQVTPVVCPC